LLILFNNTLYLTYYQINKDVCSLLQSERLWQLIEQVIQAFYPALLLLRLADQKSPAMDKLFFYVRQMDATIERSKSTLNLAEDMIFDVDSNSNNVDAKMMRYFLRSEKDKRLLANTIAREDMFGLDRKRSDTMPYDNDSDDEDTDAQEQPLEDVIDSSDDDGEEDTDTEENDYRLGDHMVAAWIKRSEKLRTDISIAGWMCSADPLVMKDVNDNHKGNHREQVNKLLQQWYLHEVGYNSEKMGQLINTFWQEFEDFQSKIGPYENREYIFNNHIDISNGNIHYWHKKETLHYTIIFGRFACRVCSKILGIGSAERSWGDVKHLKTNQRSHLSSRATKMQATIFGASCVQLARLKQQEKFLGSGAGPCKFWRMDDFDKINCGGDVVVDNTPIRYFRAWIEEWELEAIKKQDPVNETKLLAKYGGLQWRDPDNGNNKLISDKDKLHWSKPTKKNGGGYGIIAYNEHYREDDPNKKDHLEPWLITMDLVECIAEFYNINRTSENVKVIQQQEDDNDKVDEDDSVEVEEKDNDEAKYYES
jgi:hypothetical protein